jgi:hypothetical protein
VRALTYAAAILADSDAAPNSTLAVRLDLYCDVSFGSLRFEVCKAFHGALYFVAPFAKALAHNLAANLLRQLQCGFADPIQILL